MTFRMAALSLAVASTLALSWAPLHAATPAGNAPAGASASTAASAPAVDPRAPDVLVREVSQQALAALRNNPAAKSGDPGIVNRLIDQLITPWADFAQTTAICVGRHWRSATPEQRVLLEREFRELLVMIYAGGLRNFGNQTLQFRTFRPDPDPDQAVVRTFVLNKGEPIQVDYRLHKTAAGWKIYDVNVAGLWLTEAYRNQFKPILDEGGVPALLKVLEEKTAGAGISSKRK